MNILNDFISLFFPKTCFACGNNLFKNEDLICTSCFLHLPKTNFHTDKYNPVNKVFWGRVNIESATALYYYRKGSKVQELIHQMKYNGHKEIGLFLGKTYGYELLKSHDFNDIDIIIPIPLHPKKLKRRGFNQAEVFAIGLARSMDKNVDTTTLRRHVETSTQTKKSRYKRWENVNEIFTLNEPDSLNGKHVLVVDDVITTGATMEACVQTLHNIPEIKISIASIAFASQ